jgi:ABC-type dipeptide/oligopeptide/nickel transport system ATPase component
MSASNLMPVLQVQDLNVTVSKRSFPAVTSISFDLSPKSSLALVGESGSGKTLTALAIAGLLAEGLVAGGSAKLNGQELLTMNPAQRRTLAGDKIGFIFQEPMSALHPILPVGKQIAEGLRAHTTLNKAERRDRVMELLSLVGLNDVRNVANNRIGQLSGGMRQRVMIAMAISCNPDVLIADEPTTALDVTLQRQVTDLLVSLRESMGLSLLMITHNLGVVRDTCENVVVMYAGQVVESGPTETVFRGAQHEYTQALISAIPKLGDTRDRLPVIGDRAAWIQDFRMLPKDQWPRSEIINVSPTHSVRKLVGEA